MPLISVIIPVYNAESYLLETLDSLCAQVFKDIEILCIDDGSTDESPKIIMSYSNKDQRVKYVYQNNSGPGAARNHGIKLAKGEYIVFQDADDLLHPQALTLLIGTAKKYEADVTICSFQSCREDLSDVNFIIPINITPKIYTGDLALAFQNSREFRGHPWGKLYRKDVIGNIRFNDLRSGEDTYFNIDIAARSKCMAVLKIPLYIYRQSGSSLTHQVTHHANSIEAGRSIGLHCIELYRQKKISQKALLALIKRYATNGICLHVLLMIENQNLDNDERKHLLSKANQAIKELQMANPLPSDLITIKYRLVYWFTIKHQSLIMANAICKIRKLMLKMVSKFC